MTYNEIVSIVQIDGGYLVTTPSGLGNKDQYEPTIGLTLAKVLYNLLRNEGGDMPYPDNKVEGSDDVYESETLISLNIFLKTLGPKAVEKALKDNLEEAKKWERLHPEPEEVAPEKIATVFTKEVITEDGVQDI